VNHFAADVDPVKARVMYAVQQPLAASTLQDVMGVPAWKSHPSWFLVAANDEAIPPDAERLFAKRMGGHHRRSRVKSRRDGLPPGRGGAAHQDRRRSHPGGIAIRLNRAMNVKEPLLVAIDFTDIELA